MDVGVGACPSAGSECWTCVGVLAVLGTQGCLHDWGYWHLQPCQHHDIHSLHPLPAALTQPPLDAPAMLCFSAAVGSMAWGFCWPPCVAAVLADELWESIGQATPLTTNFTPAQRQQVGPCFQQHTAVVMTHWAFPAANARSMCWSCDQQVVCSRELTLSHHMLAP